MKQIHKMLSKNIGVRMRAAVPRHIVVKLLNPTNKTYRSNKKKITKLEKESDCHLISHVQH